MLADLADTGEAVLLEKPGRRAEEEAALRLVTRINPVTHMVEAERGLVHGTAAGSQILWVLAASAYLTVIFAPLIVRLYGSNRS